VTIFLTPAFNRIRIVTSAGDEPSALLLCTAQFPCACSTC